MEEPVSSIPAGSVRNRIKTRGGVKSIDVNGFASKFHLHAAE